MESGHETRDVYLLSDGGSENDLTVPVCSRHTLGRIETVTEHRQIHATRLTFMMVGLLVVLRRSVIGGSWTVGVQLISSKCFIVLVLRDLLHTLCRDRDIERLSEMLNVKWSSGRIRRTVCTDRNVCMYVCMCEGGRESVVQ